MTHHSLPSRVSYGMSFVSTQKKNDSQISTIVSTFAEATFFMVVPVLTLPPRLVRLLPQRTYTSAQTETGFAQNSSPSLENRNQICHGLTSYKPYAIRKYVSSMNPQQYTYLWWPNLAPSKIPQEGTKTWLQTKQYWGKLLSENFWHVNVT